MAKVTGWRLKLLRAADNVGVFAVSDWIQLRVLGRFGVTRRWVDPFAAGNVLFSLAPAVAAASANRINIKREEFLAWLDDEIQVLPGFNLDDCFSSLERECESRGATKILCGISGVSFGATVRDDEILLEVIWRRRTDSHLTAGQVGWLSWASNHYIFNERSLELSAVPSIREQAARLEVPSPRDDLDGFVAFCEAHPPTRDRIPPE